MLMHLQRLWRRYVRGHLISSDYEGCVTLWDVDAGAAVNEYEAHDKRIWSVDYCTADPSSSSPAPTTAAIKARHCTRAMVAAQHCPFFAGLLTSACMVLQQMHDSLTVMHAARLPGCAVQQLCMYPTSAVL